MKIDVVCWAKNGERYLSTVLAQVDKVIPKEVVNRKILVDDKSTDDTVLAMVLTLRLSMWRLIGF
jgi:glycosyltransferase involved in cell wall biosynthesis